MSKSEYVDDYFCVNCKKTTQHTLRSYNHERDSSQDSMTCNVCGKWTSSHDDDYLKSDDD